MAEGSEIFILPAYDPTFTVEKFVAYNINRNLQNFDTVVCITGYEGSGKSIVAQVLAHEFDDEYRVEDTTFYDNEAGLARMRDPTYYIVVNWDEAIEALFAAGRTREQTEIVKEFGKCRQYRHFILLCIPNLHWLDKYLREHRIVWWLHVARRGVVEVHLAVRAKADVRPTYYHIATWQLPWDDAMMAFNDEVYIPAKEHAKIAYDASGRRRKKG